MTPNNTGATAFHNHIFLGRGHEASERKTWAVIWLCGAMMVVEIIGGLVFGSIALVADGLHMSTHAGALLLAALAYTYARKHANNSNFTFGTGKLGDLAGFTDQNVHREARTDPPANFQGWSPALPASSPHDHHYIHVRIIRR